MAARHQQFRDNVKGFGFIGLGLRRVAGLGPRRYSCRTFTSVLEKYLEAWVVISRVTILITLIRGLITTLITTPEPPSRPRHSPRYSFHFSSNRGFAGLRA